MTCLDVKREEVVERYMARRLGGDELGAFEEHLLDCDGCQQEVRFAAALRVALVSPVASRSPGEPARPRRFRTGWAVAGLAAAAAIAALVVLPRVDQSEVQRLGGVSQPPIWLGVPVRADEVPTAADSLFETAMAAYEQERWEAAVDALVRAREAGAHPVPTGFFLGAAFLMTDRPEEAAEAFGDVIARGDTPYLAEARYYRAKAWLRLERVDQAMADLDAVAQGGGAMAGAARALADSLRSLPRR